MNIFENISLNLRKHDADHYDSMSQKIRLVSENWVGESIFCPSCGADIDSAPNNSKACDFICSSCDEEFELKSKEGKLGQKIVNGAYGTLIKRLEQSNNPNLYVLTYSKRSFQVDNFFVVPKYFFTPSLIEQRKPLSENARRAGWIGCNILISHIPEAGKIHYIKNQNLEPKKSILSQWQKTTFLKKTTQDSRGWLLDVMECIDKIKSQDFTLDTVYKFEHYLQSKHPENNNVKAKIRQQLQFLRDKGYIEFGRRGHYRLIK